MNKSIPERSLTSNLWVWYPNRLSTLRSFHHKNIKQMTIVTEHINKYTEIFPKINSNIFVRKENKDKEERRGQKEVWTDKKGETVNIKLLVTI